MSDFVSRLLVGFAAGVRWWHAAAILGILGISSGCKPEQVPCEPVCDRMFRKCPTAVLRSQVPLSAKQQQQIEGRALQEFSRRGYETCLRNCTARSGRGSDAPAIRKCLRAPTCAAFARCMAPHLR